MIHTEEKWNSVVTLISSRACGIS